MNSLALSFNDVTFNPVTQNDGQIWLTSTELAKALGYTETDSVSKIYNRNKDEFTNNMTLTVKMTVNGFGGGNSKKAVRIFSLRGCHLIAMLAKSKVAKQFRKWVLDLLDKEVGQPVMVRPTISIEQQKAIRTAIAKRCQQNSLHYQTIYNALYEQFNIPRYTELLATDFEKAIKFILSVQLEIKPEINIEHIQAMYLLGENKTNENYELLNKLQHIINDLDYFAGLVRKNTATQLSAFKSIEHQISHITA